MHIDIGLTGKARLPNECLSGLSPYALSLLEPHLSEVCLHEGTILWDLKDQAVDVYFPLSGLISIVIAMAEGECVSVGSIGRETMAGAFFDLGHSQILTRGLVQI